MKSNNKMKFPIAGRITSKFGNRVHPITNAVSFHNGVDIAAAVGTPVISPEAGRVTNAYYDATGGYQMIVQHDNGYTTGYAHLRDHMLKTGAIVRKGQVIANTGNSGASTGPHLHFTVRDKSGNRIDPETVFTF